MKKLISIIGVLAVAAFVYFVVHYGAVNMSRTAAENIQWRYEHALNHR
jgi:hypothetical protein